jgi:CheY-like chemotaxis protein
MSIRLLFVEDDKAQLSLFKDAVQEWNEAHPEVSFELVVADAYEAACDQLDRLRLDAALLDLRLKGGDKKLSGSRLADLCVQQYGIPAAIISGHPADFDRKAEGHEMLEVFDKGDGDAYEKAIKWFAQLSRMIDVLDGTRRNIQARGATVFYGRVWPRWRSYESLAGIDTKQLVGIVSRQYASHIADILGIDSEENVKWHPFENYVQPALLEARSHTGDVFKFEDGLWVILTPQCDMATQKAETVLMAYCETEAMLEEWKLHAEALKPGASKTKKDSADKYFGKLVNQFEPSQHFLPPLEDGKPLVVQFKKLRTMPLVDLQKSLSNRVASVASPFLSNLTQRFGSYVSRIGQPNLDISHFG